LSLLEFGSYLECSEWQLFTTYLGVSSPSKWCDHTFIILSLSFLSYFYFSIPLCSYVDLFLFDFHFLSSPYMLFNFAPIHHQHHIIVFSLGPLEVNLHTYLTTWLTTYLTTRLSKCLVRIFFGFFTIFYLEIKNHKQSETHKNVQF